MKYVLIPFLAVLCVLWFTGCKKKHADEHGKEPGAGRSAAEAVQPKEDHKHHEHSHGDGDHDDDHEKTDAPTAALPEGANQTCPVMTAEKAKADVFVEYEGKRIYLCCKKCKERVVKDPASWYKKAYGKGS